VPSTRRKRSGPSRTVGGDRDLASVGALVADRAKCQILVALAADGGALPAGRLAAVAEVSASTASGHLHKLVAGGLLMVENAGRLRNYRLADPEIVADLIEILERLAPTLRVDEVEVVMQVETRGPAHCDEVISELRTAGYQLMFR